MDDGSKIALSPAELSLLQDADWLLTKQRLMQKAEAQLGLVAAAYVSIAHSLATADSMIWKKQPKISKGERYNDLPWLMLDYPRFFETPNHVAIRTMLLWGRHVAIMLHVSGHAAHKAMESWSARNTGGTEWQVGYLVSPYRFEIHEQSLYAHPVVGEDGLSYARMAKYYPVTAINNLLPALALDFEVLLHCL